MPLRKKRAREWWSREVDSMTPFEASNYGTATTSSTEYWFVADPDAGRKEKLGVEAYPGEVASTLEVEKRRKALAPSASAFRQALDEIETNV